MPASNTGTWERGEPSEARAVLPFCSRRRRRGSEIGSNLVVGNGSASRSPRAGSPIHQRRRQHTILHLLSYNNRLAVDEHNENPEHAPLSLPLPSFPFDEPANTAFSEIMMSVDFTQEPLRNGRPGSSIAVVYAPKVPQPSPLCSPLIHTAAFHLHLGFIRADCDRWSFGSKSLYTSSCSQAMRMGSCPSEIAPSYDLGNMCVGTTLVRSCPLLGA